MDRPNPPGLAFGILLDATVIRSLLVPALLSFLGERAWYRKRGLLGEHATVHGQARALDEV